MTKMEAMDAMILRYEDIVRNWESLSIGDIMDALWKKECLMKSYHPNCFKTPSSCPEHGRVCGKKIVQPANHDWKSDSVKQYFVGALQALREWRERLVGCKL